MSYIGLLDCNNFFVSCERLFRPDLRTTPTMVLSSNDGCVVARSQEVKDMGIMMGVPYFKIKDSLKNVEHSVFSSNFTLYRDISSRVFSVMKNEVDGFEQYSIDEAFFFISSNQSLEQIELFISGLRSMIWQQTGILVSVGVSNTKTQAKYANVLAKKTTGTRIVDNNEFRELSHGILLGSVWGVGVGRVRQFASAGLHSVYDLIMADRARVEKLFGIEGVRIQSELSGQSALALVEKQSVAKSITSSRSFNKESMQLEVVLDAVTYHLRNVAVSLREKGLKASKLKVYAYPSYHGDYMLRGGSNVVSLITPTNDSFILIKEGLRLMEDLFEANVPYKKVGVVVSELVPIEQTQGNLFEKEKDNPLLRILDTLNHSMGHDAIKLGMRSGGTLWQSERNTLSPSYTTKWSDLAIVKA